MQEAEGCQLNTSQKSLYKANFVRWVETTVEQLRTQNYTCVDWTNLIEEIEDISRRERKTLKSDLIIILLHLLTMAISTRVLLWELARERVTLSR